MIENQNKIKGLSDNDVSLSRNLHGNNSIEIQEDRVFWYVLKGVVLEPMFILLLAACVIYFIVGQHMEGIIMLVSIFIVAAISLYQEYRSQNAIHALRKLSAPRSNVIRNGIASQIPAEEIVVDDILQLEEGEIIAADGLLISANDLSINESILTGESYPVNKTAADSSSVYKGTLVTSGSAIVRVSGVGNKTMFGKIGLSLKEITVVKTPLQNQIRSFVRIMVWIGAIAFLIVVGYNYYQSADLVKSFLQGLTLAMSILPEEIPVAFATFQALGAFRLLQNNIIVKQPQYVETLGSATVICADKTGTLTQNKMSIEYLYDAATKMSVQCNDVKTIPAMLVEYAMWSSETNPFDPMEKTIHELYQKTAATDKRTQFKQVHEYPIGGKPPMMTHIFKNEQGEMIIAAKGAPEAILKRSNLSVAELKHVEEQSLSYAKQGYRVLGVGKGVWKEKHWPVSQEEFVFEFLGLIAFQDPPKPNIAETIKTFHDAGISVKMITGDYAETAIAIAQQIKLDNSTKVLTGEEILHLSTEELKQKVKEINIFARMFPEAKLKVIDALKENGEVVAMTGDGVNDAPALKAAHIGIAMGKRGSEVAKNAASLILTDDDLGHMTDAVALGRKIYDNLKKAIQYIVSIHIPIILIVTLPLLFLWKFTDIFSPVHVIFLELIMGPTCSIIYENEPMEPGTMSRPPRPPLATFLSAKQLRTSIAQGLMITAGCLGAGYYFMQHQADESIVRTSIFITLLFCNIFLTFINRSFKYSIFYTIRYKNYLVPLITGITFLFILSLLYFPFARQLFRLGTLSFSYLIICVIVALVSTFWIELFKPGKK
ncbi:MAG TPA: cation-translocating P-type ATPase [Chitinophagaceae bacterium]